MLPRFTVIAVSLLCACTDPELGSSEQDIAMPIGGVATNGVATNGVATNGVATNAAASDALATRPLVGGSGLTEPAVALGLHDPNARIFMKYLVSCALAPGQDVTWRSADGAITEVWHGALGLCPQWHKDAPDAGCRQRVSSCILARNNAFGVSVMFSMRGDNGARPIGLSPSVPAHDRYPQTNIPVASLASCRRRMSGPQRDCGWSVASVGRCTPYTSVSIAEGNQPQCSGAVLGVESDADTMLRVCEGTSACDATGAIASVGTACGVKAPGIDFTCPTSGLYAVMIGPEDSGRSIGGGTIAATSQYAAPYPAPEGDVFRWREGAFYGDIFGSQNMAVGKPQVSVNPTTYQVEGLPEAESFVGVSFPNMYACSSDNWVDSVAYIARRVCAGPSSPGSYNRDCAANYVGPCRRNCDTNDSTPLGDEDYDDCRAPSGEVYRFPMTPLLAGPCDVIPGACATVPNAPVTW